MPIALIQDENTQRFQLVGLCSLEQARNLFVAPDGRWLGGYVPAVLRGYPFGLMRVETSEQVVLAVDEASGLVVSATEPDAQRFFDGEGRPAETLQQILGFLTEIDANLAMTNRALLRLEEAGLIVPWPITLMDGNNQKNVNGLFCIDVDRLTTLENKVFLSLREDYALAIAFYQSLSKQQITLFSTLKDLQEKMEENNKLHQKTIEESFAVKQQEDVKFDWSNL